MAQTKRKRRTKHRGNAAGMVEARGRTSKPAEAAKTKGGRSKGSAANGRNPRGAGAPLKPPSVQSAALKALFGVAILFVFFRFIGQQNSTAEALSFCALAFVMYVPIMFFTDRFIYNRKLAKQPAARR